MQFFRVISSRAVFAFIVMVGLLGGLSAASAETIDVQGNRRVDSDTIRSYVTGADKGGLDQAVKDMKATGLFSDVRARRDGGRIIVSVVENNVINRVAFEGNSKVKSETLTAEVQTKSRGPYSPTLVQADIERIKDIYKHNGRGLATVTYRTVDLPNGRIDVVFTVNEGDKTGVKQIHFVGNTAFSEGKLVGLMQTTEMNLLSWIKTSDVYDPDRISADLELIRRYYLKNGYADFRVVTSDAKFDANEGGWIVTITVDEGLPYKVASVTVDSRLPDVDSATLRGRVRFDPGDSYNGDLVEKSTEGITREIARRGYAFSQVRPRGDRDPVTHTITLGFVVEEGPRVYIERINVRGNTRTRDYVVRREFDIGEGDAYNRVLIDRAERRLNNLGYFKKVRITNEPGSSPDRVIVNVDVEDQPTGAFAISGGYSTSDGLVAEVSVTESNFLGRGQYVKAAVQEGQNTRGVDLSFTEPYFLDQRIAAGFDLFSKQTDNSKYAQYSNYVTGGTLRLGLPVTDEITFSPRYSIYQSKIKIPNKRATPYDDCSFPIDGVTPGFGSLANAGRFPSAGDSCLSNGEASIAIKESAGSTLTSLVGYTLSYNTLDNYQAPTDGLYGELRQDLAGLGGDSKFLRTTGDLRYYHEIYDNIIGIARVQGGNIFSTGSNPLRLVDEFNLGPQLVRGFAPSGIGPRDLSDPTNYKSNPLGGTNYYGGSLEVQFPIYGLPREIGLKGALFADAGSLFGYKGRTNFTTGGGACVPSNVSPLFTQGTCVTARDTDKIRSSVGASIIWASPLGPIRFDYAVALTKDKYDVTQAFRFSGGTRF